MNKADIKKKLKQLFPKGSTAYTIVTKVAPSGMSRHIMVTGCTDMGAVGNVSWFIAHLLGYKYKDNTRSVFVGGAGMDMGFHLVYNLAQELYKDGYAIKQQWL